MSECAFRLKDGRKMNTSNLKQAKPLFLLIAALAFASCRQTARQTVADAEQPTDSTEALTSADTLRLVIADLYRTIIAMMDLMPSDALAALYTQLKGFERYAREYYLPKGKGEDDPTPEPDPQPVFLESGASHAELYD